MTPSVLATLLPHRSRTTREIAALVGITQSETLATLCDLLEGSHVRVTVGADGFEWRAGEAVE